MKKVYLKKLTKDERNKLLRAYEKLSENSKMIVGDVEEYLKNNDNQTLQAITAIINSQPWGVDEKAQDIIELKNIVKKAKEDFVYLEDRHVNIFLEAAKTARIKGEGIEAVLEVSEQFKKAEEYNPNKQ